MPAATQAAHHIDGGQAASHQGDRTLGVDSIERTGSPRITDEESSGHVVIEASPWRPGLGKPWRKEHGTRPERIARPEQKLDVPGRRLKAHRGLARDDDIVPCQRGVDELHEVLAVARTRREVGR